MTLTAIVLAAAALPAAAPSAAWEIDTSHSAAHFTVRHMIVGSVRGDMRGVTGTVHLYEKEVARSSVEARIDASTVNTRDAKRDGHLKSADFFDVATHPAITFRSTSVARGRDGRLKVTGELTIRGVTRSAVLDVTIVPGEIKGMRGLYRGATATTKLSRKEFGLKWNMPLEGGGLLVGDEVSVDIDLELVRKEPGKS